MTNDLSRREFMIGIAALAAASTAYPNSLVGVDNKIRFGYAAITWEGNDLQAIKDISALGFKGIQLRSNVLKEYGERPKALRDLLQEYNLEFVALSSGGVRVEEQFRADEIAKHTANARFVHDVGGKYLQVTVRTRRIANRFLKTSNSWAGS